MKSLWVARDTYGLFQYVGKPSWNISKEWWNPSKQGVYLCSLPNSMFPEVKIGECKELELKKDQ